MEKSERLHKSNVARKKRMNVKKLREELRERLYNKLRKQRKKKNN